MQGPVHLPLEFKYTRLQTLGKGSFGEAILVQQKEAHHYFVAKAINLGALSAKEKEDARNEVRLLSQLNHPNIIKMYECLMHRSRLYIIMEWADAGDLDKKLRKAEQEKTLIHEDLAMNWFVQLCLAVKHLHSLKILHRDLKTQNVLLMRSGIVKLGDFGISTVLRNTLAQAMTVCGTPYYFSPEICKSQPYNNKSDIWALGCVLYEIVALKHPFSGLNIYELMTSICNGAYSPIPTLYSLPLDILLSKLLSLTPLLRPSIDLVLRNDLIREHLRRLITMPPPPPVHCDGDTTIVNPPQGKSPDILPPLDKRPTENAAVRAKHLEGKQMVPSNDAEVAQRSPQWVPEKPPALPSPRHPRGHIDAPSAHHVVPEDLDGPARPSPSSDPCLGPLEPPENCHRPKGGKGLDGNGDGLEAPRKDPQSPPTDEAVLSPTNATVVAMECWERRKAADRKRRQTSKEAALASTESTSPVDHGPRNAPDGNQARAAGGLLPQLACTPEPYGALQSGDPGPGPEGPRRRLHVLLAELQEAKAADPAGQPYPQGRRRSSPGPNAFSPFPHAVPPIPPQRPSAPNTPKVVRDPRLGAFRHPVFEAGLMPVPPVRPDLLPPVQAAPRLFADLRQARQGEELRKTRSAPASEARGPRGPVAQSSSSETRHDIPEEIGDPTAGPPTEEEYATMRSLIHTVLETESAGEEDFGDEEPFFI